MLKCPICSHEFTDKGEIEDHLKNTHFLDMAVYYEMDLRENEYCYRCGNSRHPLTYLDPTGFKVPCWDCLKDDRYEKPQAIETIRRAIVDHYVTVKDDRYLQMFLVDKIFFNNTLPHTYEEFKAVLKRLQKVYSIDRNKIWFPDFIPGYPKIFSRDNIGGLKIVPVNDLYVIDSGKSEIRINDKYIIKYADIIPYDQRHHSRYNLFNLKTETRNTKRLRLKESSPDKCIKFYNKLNEQYNSIFDLTDIEGNPILFSGLSELDKVVIKLVLLRNKSFFRLLIDLIDEVLRNVGILSDPVFLRNTVTVNPGCDLRLHLSWLPEETRENYINISIL